MKRITSIIMAILFTFLFTTSISALEIKEPSLNLNVKSAILMDANTGTILYSQNENQALPPASVTKVMTLLLTFEAIENGSLNYDDMLVVSENAASMGGSQIFLEPGEEMSVIDLLKSVIM
jgi:D-alanyl-D-alanine carboxypeptidase (penicillin-binding protein 5/6)